MKNVKENFLNSKVSNFCKNLSNRDKDRIMRVLAFSVAYIAIAKYCFYAGYCEGVNDFQNFIIDNNRLINDKH